MAKRILRGGYEIRTLGGGWRRGTLVAGQRIKLNEGDYLEGIEFWRPMKLVTPDGLLIMPSPPTFPTYVHFDPFTVCRTFDVRQAGRG